MHYSSLCSKQPEQRQLSVQFLFQSSALQLPHGGHKKMMRSMGPEAHALGLGSNYLQGWVQSQKCHLSQLCLGKAGGGICFKKGGFFLASLLCQRQGIMPLFSRVLLESFSCTFVSQGFSVKMYKTLKTLRFWFIFSGVCKEGLVKAHSPKWPKITM